MKTYTAHARRWEHGWELHVEGVGVTQARTLAAADRQVRDLVATMLDVDAESATVVIHPELDGIEGEVTITKRKAERAARLQVESAREARSQARRLREAGLSVSDIAVVMHVSRGRASQLLDSPR